MEDERCFGYNYSEVSDVGIVFYCLLVLTLVLLSRLGGTHRPRIGILLSLLVNTPRLGAP